MTHIYIGANRIRGSRQGYFHGLSALEVPETHARTVTDKRLSQWRSDSPKGFCFSLQAPLEFTHSFDHTRELPAALRGFKRTEFGRFRQTEANAAAWDLICESANAAAAKFILLQAPRDFMPNAENRAKLEWIAKELAPKTKATVAFEAPGLWELEESVPWCREIGLVPVYDPFSSDDIPGGWQTAYFALYTRRGLRTKFDDFDMEELLEKCQAYQRAAVFFRGADFFRDARLCQTVWETLKEEEDAL